MSSSSSYAELEIGLHKIETASYQVELRFSHPGSEAELPPERGTVAFDLTELHSLQSDPEAYGAALTRGLFPEAERNVLALYGKARAAAEADDLQLRLRLFIAPSAAELQALRWELLRDPEDPESGGALATSERTLLSRFMVSYDYRPVRLRPKADLTALLAVAAPSDLARFQLAAVDAGGEIDRARGVLAEIRVAVAGRDRPLTLERLVAGLSDGVDVLYLVCHGALSRHRREAVLYLQKDDGTTAVVRAAELAERVAELRQPPRLVVLASCESAGTEDGTSAAGETTAQTSLAPRLAEAGVAAVVAMQGRISMETVEKAMPVFFRELMKDGQIDRALAAARAAVRARRDAWMPALYMRLKRGRIWYVPGFSATGADGDEFPKWKSIVGSVRRQRFVPILGPDVGEHLFGSVRERALGLARDYGFPLAAHHGTDLAKVAQFLSVEESPTEARQAVVRQLHREILKRRPGLDEDARKLSLAKLLDVVAAEHLGEARDDADPGAGDPYRILTELPAPLYVNTSPDPVLVKALKAAGRPPILLCCDWRPTPENHPREPVCEHDPSPERPIVYQPFGVFGKWDSVVLTEDDFLDYLIAASTYKLMPRVVRSTLVESSLLFLGFPLEDWAFRVFFRMIMTLSSTAKLERNAHVGVQVDPEEYGPADVERARRYLARYFGAAPRIEVYWGGAADFLRELRSRLATMRDDDVTERVEEDEDDWL